MEDAIYGGRIDNIFDMRVLTAYLRLFFTQKIVFGGDRGTNIYYILVIIHLSSSL